MHGNVHLTSTPPHIFMTSCLIRQRGNFVFHNMMQIIRGSQFGRIRETTRKKLWHGGQCFSEQTEEGKGTPAENIFLPQILYRTPNYLACFNLVGPVFGVMRVVIVCLRKFDLGCIFT